MGNHHPSRRAWCYGLAGLVSLFSAGAHASGFALIEQSVSSMGTAYANGSAGIDDASTIFFNPATMTRLDGINIAGGVHVIAADTDFKGSASYNPNNPAIQQSGLAGVPIQGKNKTDTDLVQPVPHFGYSQQFDDRIWYGMTVNAPFGLKTDYDDDDWVGRYNARKSELITVNINPAFAFKVDEHVSIGAGLSALYADGELTNSLDNGLLAALGGAPIPGWVPGTNTYDSKAKLTGDDWGWSFNAGGLLEPSKDTRLGFAYRSGVDLEIEGDVKVTGREKVDAKLDLNLPASISVSGWHQFTPKFAMMADATWTQWSDFDELKVKLDTGNSILTPEDWDDTMRYAIGATYQFNERWLFRTGAAFDESPVRNKELRTARIPDEDRTWLTLGANYRLSKQLDFDFGYAHLFVDDPEVENDSSHTPETGLNNGFHLLSGEYDSSVNMFSVQVNWKFK